MRRALPVVSLLLLLQTAAVWGLWTKEPDSDTDRFCIAVNSDCLGLIDSTGRVIVRFDPPRRSFYDFHDGRTPMHDPVTGQEGYVDASGDWAIPPRFYVARPFRNGHAVVHEEAGSPWRLIDKSGAFVGPPAEYGIDDFHAGLAAVHPSGKELAGYIDPSGDWSIPQRFRTAYRFSEEDLLAAVQDPDGLWGYIDTHGDYKIPPKFLWARSFEHGRASVVTDGPCWRAIEHRGDSPPPVSSSSNPMATSIPFPRRRQMSRSAAQP